ncbi:MAG: nucleotide sugar dehydrogenase [Bacteroidota bacterium]
MKISIFGLGYVGSVSAACLAELGHQVYGVDIMPEKVNALCKGQAPVKEPRLDQLLRQNLDAGRLHFTTDPGLACRETDYAMIAVGTPSNSEGAVDLSAIDRCVQAIANTLKENEKKHYTIIIRSTVPPGTTQRLKSMAQQALGDQCQLSICMNPEFLREGSAVKDFFNPALVVFGTEDEGLQDQLAHLYHPIEAPHVWLNSRTAELVKYTNNAFHGLKVAFANEIGRIAAAYDSDGEQIMELLCADTKLNISNKYLRPGFAFGGSCIPKDLRGINSIAKSKSVETPLLRSIIESNDAHIHMFCQQILREQPRKLAILGIAFKTGTDDLRESAGLRLASELVKNGIAIKMMDANLHLEKLFGTNRQYIDEILPSWENCYVESAEALFNFADTIVITTHEKIHQEWIAQYGQNKTIKQLG